MNDDDTTFSITLDEDYLTDTGSEYTFNLTSSDHTYTIDPNGNSEFIYNTLDNYIDPDEVENMCKEYPALSKVWRNFKSVYDMTLQDYKGKKEIGDINDPIPF